MEILVLSALFAVMAASSVLAFVFLDKRNEELEEHLDELSTSVDERFEIQLEVSKKVHQLMDLKGLTLENRIDSKLTKLHAQVDGIESNIEKEGISTLTLNSRELPSEKIREGLIKFGAKERKLKSAKDMTFNLAKPKKKQARKTR
jgi:hypothetical protein